MAGQLFVKLSMCRYLAERLQEFSSGLNSLDDNCRQIQMEGRFRLAPSVGLLGLVYRFLFDSAAFDGFSLSSSTVAVFSQVSLVRNR